MGERDSAWWPTCLYSIALYLSFSAHSLDKCFNYIQSEAEILRAEKFPFLGMYHSCLTRQPCDSNYWLLHDSLVIPATDYYMTVLWFELLTITRQSCDSSYWPLHDSLVIRATIKWQSCDSSYWLLHDSLVIRAADDYTTVLWFEVLTIT